jgi:hypothetical protein
LRVGLFFVLETSTFSSQTITLTTYLLSHHHTSQIIPTRHSIAFAVRPVDTKSVSRHLPALVNWTTSPPDQSHARLAFSLLTTTVCSHVPSEPNNRPTTGGPQLSRPLKKTLASRQTTEKDDSQMANIAQIEQLCEQLYSSPDQATRQAVGALVAPSIRVALL